MNITFGDILKNIRLQRGMSQEELATLLGTTKQVISRYETNQRTPKITVANEYAKRLGISLDTLLGSEASTPCRPLPSLTAQETAIIRKYRILDDRGRAVVESVLDHEYQSALGKEADPLSRAD